MTQALEPAIVEAVSQYGILVSIFLKDAFKAIFWGSGCGLCLSCKFCQAGCSDYWDPDKAILKKAAGWVRAGMVGMLFH